MIVFVSYICVLFLTLVSSAQIPGVRPTENFKHSAVLDKNYTLFWNYNDTHVTFEAHVKTKGYVGFGISDKGRMYPGDVVVGWVDNGVTHFGDYHTVNHSKPLLDASQDWYLLLGQEDDTSTILKFVRQIDTCDSSGDIIIQEDTVRLIYAYGDHDPVDDNGLFYHGPSHRGTKTVSLLSEFQVPDNLPTDIRHIEFLQRNFIIPNASTTYHCMGFQMPDLGGKHHMIHYEPVITPGNELHFHHALLYRCDGINSSYDGVEGHCYRRDRPLPNCYDIVIAWAIGGQPFYFPSNAGFSVGDTNDASFYILETHYDNPKLESGLIDSSGIRISITKSLRTHDAGMLEMGYEVNWRQIVPPHQNDYLSVGYCSASCLAQGIHESQSNEIKIFAALHHAHLLGVGMKTRHFRNGTEIAPLMNDPDYDFDFQEMRKLPKERVVKPGDSFSIECTYDSTGRSGVTFGGLGTQEEMCLTFAYYYPRIQVSSCLSEPSLNTFPEQGRTLYNIIRGLDWRAPHVITDFKNNIKNSDVSHHCIMAGNSSYGLFRFSQEVFVEHELAQPYQAPPSSCATSG